MLLLFKFYGKIISVRGNLGKLTFDKCVSDRKQSRIKNKLRNVSTTFFSDNPTYWNTEFVPKKISVVISKSWSIWSLIGSRKIFVQCNGNKKIVNFQKEVFAENLFQRFFYNFPNLSHPIVSSYNANVIFSVIDKFHKKLFWST